MFLNLPISIRYFSPGMPEMLGPSAALIGAGLGKDVALVTDGRFSGASHGKQPSHSFDLITEYK